MKKITYSDSGYFKGKSFFSDNEAIFCKEIVYSNGVPSEEILYEIIDYNGYEAYILIPGKIEEDNNYGVHVPIGFWNRLNLVKFNKEELEETEKPHIKDKPENNMKLMSDYVAIEYELYKDLLKMIDNEITDCVDNPMYGGRAPESLYKIKDELEKAEEI
jgi:hypothetical protein